MSKKVICTVAILSTLLLSAFASAFVHLVGMPKLDETEFQVIKTAESAKNALLTGQVDVIRGLGRAAWISEVLAAGFNVTFVDTAKFSALLINLRDTYPLEVQGGTEGKKPGDPVAPLNDPAFRRSLQYIWGMDKKNASIFNYAGGPWTFGMQSPVPPAQVPWFNPNVKLPTSNNATAWAMLQAAGYYVNSTDSKLYNPDGTPVRNLNVLYTSNETFWEIVAGDFVGSFNNFMTYINATGGPTMNLVGKDFITLIFSLLVSHDFDIIAMESTNLGRYVARVRGRFVDWLADLLLSEMIGLYLPPSPWKIPPPFPDPFRQNLTIILTSVDPDEVRAVAWAVQEHFNYVLYPWIPVAAGKEIVAHHPDLLNIIPMPIYGGLNDWTWNLMHWKQYAHPTLGINTLRFSIGDEPDDLNPLNEDTLYGWDLLDRAITGLTIVEPNNLTDMPYVAFNWKVEHHVSIPGLGITDGSKVTFWLRQDVKWHDGKPVTAYDGVNNMRLLREYKPGRYLRVWENLVYEEADGPYKFSVYFYRPSLYYSLYVAETALLAPKHITDLVERQVEEGVLPSFFDWDPALDSYKALTGVDPPAKYPFMKAIVGTGPYVFDYYNFSTLEGRVQRFEEFFINETGMISAVDGEYRIDPCTPQLTYSVIIQHMGAIDNVTGRLAPVTVDVHVYEDGASALNITGVTLDPFTHKTFGPYTTSYLPAGPHTVKVELIEAGSGATLHTYTHAFAVTEREDTNYDFKVDMRDIAAAALAFGSYPGHLRWYPPADINDDFKIDIRDIGAVARIFGWIGGCTF